MTEIVIQQDNIRAGFSGFCRFGKGNGGIGTPQGKDIIHAVTGHSDFMSFVLQSHDKGFLLFGRNTGKNRIFFSKSRNVL